MKKPTSGQLANPGERSKLSDATLAKYAPALLAKRKANRQAATNAMLYDPTAVLSGPALKSAANQIVRGQYGPQEAELTRQGGYLDEQQKETAQRIAGVYSQLSSLTAPSVNQAVTGSQQLADKIRQSGVDLTNATNAAEAGYESRAAQDAAIRGTGLDAGMATRLAAEFADQKIRAASQTQGAQSIAGAQSQGFIGNVGTAQAVLPARATQAVQDLSNKVALQRQELLSKKADLTAAEGEARTKTLMDLRDTEFQKQAAIETLHLKGQAADTAAARAQETVTHNRTMEQINSDRAAEIRRHNRAMEKANTNADRLAETQRHNKKMEALAQERIDKGGKGKGTSSSVTPFGNKLLAPAGQTKQQSNFGKLVGFAKTHIGKEGRHGLAKDLWSDSSSAELRKAIGLSADTPEAVVSAALDIADFGYLSRGTIHKLWRAGISVKGLGVPTKPGVGKRAATHIPGVGGTVG